MVFLCWVVCVCLSVSAWPGCLSLPLDAGQGHRLPTLDDPNAANTQAQATQAQLQHSNQALVAPNYNTLLPLLRLPQDPHSIGLGPVGESQEIYRELSNGAESTDSSSARLLEALQQQGLSGQPDTTGVDLPYEVADPRLMALLDDLMTQQQRHTQVVSVNVENLTFKISRHGETAKKIYQIQTDKKDCTNYLCSLQGKPSPARLATIQTVTFQNGADKENDIGYVTKVVNDKFEDTATTSEQGNIDDIEKVSETRNNAENIISRRNNRAKRSTTTLSIDYSLKILRDTLLQELKRKKQQRVLLRRLRENQQQLLNIG